MQTQLPTIPNKILSKILYANRNQATASYKLILKQAMNMYKIVKPEYLPAKCNDDSGNNVVDEYSMTMELKPYCD